MKITLGDTNCPGISSCLLKLVQTSVLAYKYRRRDLDDGGKARDAEMALFFQENVLLKQRGSCSIKVIDFGSSCYSHQRVYTYIQSRFYRSPEVILGLPYGTAIDMWSLGCILAELYSGYPLFPGENEIEQLACIMELLGRPPEQLISHASRRRLFFGEKRNSPDVSLWRGCSCNFLFSSFDLQTREGCLAQLSTARARRGDPARKTSQPRSCAGTTSLSTLFEDAWSN